MKVFHSGEQFNPLDHTTPLDVDQVAELDIAHYSRPKVVGKIGDVHFVKNHFEMRDGWRYDAVSTVLPSNKLATPISGTMTTGWFTNEERGFNRRRLATLGKHGAEFTSVSVPLNMNRLWGDMEANAYNQARIGRAMAGILGRHPHMFFEDGLSRGAMTGESVIGVSPEVDADVIFGYNTVPCRINGVEEVDDLAEVIRGLHPAALGRAALRGQLPDIAHIRQVLRAAGRGIGEAFGNEFKPIQELISNPLEQVRSGASINEAVSNTIGKFHPNSIAVPYNILGRYPTTADVTPRRLFRQVMEAWTLTDGTYGEVAKKVAPDQFQVLAGFKGDGLSHFEEIEAWHDTESHPNTIIAKADGGRHLSVVIEEANREWSSRWASVIEATADLGVHKLEDLSPSERATELHRRSADINPFFAKQQHTMKISDNHPDVA